jgi:triacylglycerol lipase
MSYVIAAPEFVTAAATDLANVASSVGEANTVAAARTTSMIVAAGDEVSAAVASLFTEHAQMFHALSARASAFHAQFVQALNAAGGAYTGAESANASKLVTNIFGSLPKAIPANQGAIFTGTPSLATRFEIGSLFAFKGLASYLGHNATNVLSRAIGAVLSLEFTTSPPKFLPLLLGETVQHTTFDGMSVLQITPAHPSGHYVVALPGGDFSLEPSFFHWVDYTVMAAQTGATIEVPFYPLVPQGGTAGVVVPEIASFISAQIAVHGAPYVSVTGDSSGGNLALATVEYMVANNETVPGSMVLVSPWLDVTMTNPNIPLVRDPFVNSPLIAGLLGSDPNVGSEWAGNLPETNYMVSPLYGSLKGLPPTYVYAGSLDSLTPDAILLQQNAAIAGAPFSFVFANGEFHDWVYLTPDGFELLPQIYQELRL